MKRPFVIAFIVLVLLLLLLNREIDHHRQVPPRIDVEEGAPNVDAPPPGTSGSPVGSVATSGLATSTGGASATPVPFKSLSDARGIAQSSLVAAYSSEKAFQAEWSRYSSDLVMAGWEPPESDVNYKMGFLAKSDDSPLNDGRVYEDPSRFSTDAFVNREPPNPKFRYTPAAEKINLNEYARDCEHGCRVDGETFEILLVIPLDDQGHIDVWTINEKRELRHVEDGTAK